MCVGIYMLCRSAGITDTLAMWSVFIWSLDLNLGPHTCRPCVFYLLLNISWNRDFSLVSLSGIVLLLKVSFLYFIISTCLFNLLGFCLPGKCHLVYFYFWNRFNRFSLCVNPRSGGLLLPFRTSEILFCDAGTQEAEAGAYHATSAVEGSVARIPRLHHFVSDKQTNKKLKLYWSISFPCSLTRSLVIFNFVFPFLSSQAAFKILFFGKTVIGLSFDCQLPGNGMETYY